MEGLGDLNLSNAPSCMQNQRITDVSHSITARCDYKITATPSSSATSGLFPPRWSER
jgi:hypothetical protein